MLEVKNLSIVVDNKKIINNLSFILKENDKIAVIGEEGNGKSTLLKVIYDSYLASYAEVNGVIERNNNTIHYLEQFISNDYYSKKVFDYLFKDTDEYYNKIGDLYDFLNLLSISDSILQSYIKNLSGGEKVRIQLLKMFISDADIYILDEPTNDLDIRALAILEDFIINCEKPIIYVSHDECLLSKTANKIVHLELVKKKNEAVSTVVSCSYEEYIDKRFNFIDKQIQISRKENANYKKQHTKLMQIMNKVHHQLNSISRGNPHGAKMLKKKMKSLKSQEKRLENKVLTEMPSIEESINIFFDNTNMPGKKRIIDLNIPVLSIGNNILSNNIKLEVMGYEHMVIIGNNGCGKTTLLRMLHTMLSDRDDIRLGYMPQNYDDILNNNDTPIDFLAIIGDKDEITQNRSYLGNINFTHDEMTGKIGNLSGGSKAKLILLKLIIDKCNVLILDEPTRNVSPLSNPVIRRILRDFDGTIISVSHDRKYIEEVCDSMYLLDFDGLHKL